MAEDPGLAGGLAPAGKAALVDPHGRAALAQRERRAEPDDPGPDHADVGLAVHAASVPASIGAIAPLRDQNARESVAQDVK